MITTGLLLELRTSPMTDWIFGHNFFQQNLIMAQVAFFLCILFVQHENEDGYLTKCLRVLLIFPQSLNPSVKTHGELNSSLETSLLSSFFWMFLSSCGHFHLDIQETYQSSRVQNRPLVLNFPCPFPTSTPFSLLQLPKTNIRNYP